MHDYITKYDLERLLKQLIPIVELTIEFMLFPGNGDRMNLKCV